MEKNNISCAYTSFNNIGTHPHKLQDMCGAKCIILWEILCGMEDNYYILITSYLRNITYKAYHYRTNVALLVGHAVPNLLLRLCSPTF
jgi:hypothetical protein